MHNLLAIASIFFMCISVWSLGSAAIKIRRLNLERRKRKEG